MELGKVDDAENLLKHALDGAISVYGLKHPNVLCIKHRIAEIHFAQKKIELARSEILDVISSKVKVMGWENAETARSLDLYGHISEKLGNSEQARLIYSQAYGIRCRTLGVDTPFTLESKKDLQNCDLIAVE